MNAYRANGGCSGMEYDRWVEQRSADIPNKSAMTKIQQQYWVTKQSVYRKLGKKEDECIVASDAELDAKLELFRSIQESCHDLQRIIDKYQERLCTLAQEENAMGRFLKESGKSDKTRAGKMMTAVGKSLSYSGQQRLALRTPLLRLHQEVDTFRHRAIDDTLGNVRSMEKMRVEYRASLNWMKNVSTELDPDTYAQLDKFRKVQAQVRRNKAKFDQLKLDCLQKIDLLTAARCNMFSHALILYQNSLIQFAEKTTRTFATITNSFKGYQHYEFCVVKELSEVQSLAAGQAAESGTDLAAQQDIDTDKLLFFEPDYQDDPEPPPPSAVPTAPTSLAAPTSTAAPSSLDAPLLDLSLDETEQRNTEPHGIERPINELDFLDFQSGADEMALLAEILSTQSYPVLEPSSDPDSGFLPSHLLDLALHEPAPGLEQGGSKMAAAAAAPKQAWLDLFADLGPLADPDSMGGVANADRNC